MESIGTFKRGDTLAFYANLTNPSGDPLTGAAASLSSQIRTHNDVKKCDLTITEWVDPDAGKEGHTTITGRYLLTYDGSTQAWEPGTYYTDIEYTDGSSVTSTATMMLTVEKDITHA